MYTKSTHTCGHTRSDGPLTRPLLTGLRRFLFVSVSTSGVAANTLAYHYGPCALALLLRALVSKLRLPFLWKKKLVKKKLEKKWVNKIKYQLLAGKACHTHTHTLERKNKHRQSRVVFQLAFCALSCLLHLFSPTCHMLAHIYLHILHLRSNNCHR